MIMIQFEIEISIWRKIFDYKITFGMLKIGIIP